MIDDNIDDRDTDGKTALHNAARISDPYIAQFFIDEGADVNAMGVDGITVLRSAIDYGHTDMVKYLVDNGAREL